MTTNSSTGHHVLWSVTKDTIWYQQPITTNRSYHVKRVEHPVSPVTVHTVVKVSRMILYNVLSQIRTLFWRHWMFLGGFKHCFLYDKFFIIFCILAITCPRNDSAISPANGVALCSSSNHEYQTVCTTDCNSGYTTSEVQRTECQSNKQWSNTLAGCEGT